MNLKLFVPGSCRIQSWVLYNCTSEFLLEKHMKKINNGTLLLHAMMALVLFGLTANSIAGTVLKVDFNSTTQDGGPHSQDDWTSYDAAHEVEADFNTKTYGSITVTPDYPNTTDNRVMQMIDRGVADDDNWDNGAGDIDLVTDWLGVDTRTANGGLGAWDGTIGTPTYITITLGGLVAGNYEWTSFHHDTEKMWGPFAAWVSTDGGTTFIQLADGHATNSTTGGDPLPLKLVTGPDINTLSSTYVSSFLANGIDAVVMRFAPYSLETVHRTFFVMNAFKIDVVDTANTPNPINGEGFAPKETDLSWLAPDASTYTPTEYRVFFGTTEPNDLFDDYGLTELTTAGSPLFTATTIAPSSLAFGEKYYWVVDAYDAETLYRGSHWSFTTEPDDRDPLVTIVDTADEIITWLVNLPETELSGTVDDSGEGDIASITWEIISGPGIAHTSDMQMIWRNGDNIVGDPNLLMDWIGTDTRGVGTKVMTLTLSGLPAGSYNWTSYHHDTDNQTGVFNVTVDDSTGSVTTNGIDVSAGLEAVTTFASAITSDGSDVTLSFNLPLYSEVVESFFVMNGFELTGSGTPLNIDFNRDDNVGVIAWL